MDAKEEALGALFRTDVRFVVPRFQRRYVWSLDNWTALWSDVLSAVDRYTDPVKVPQHFLGAVVLLSGAASGPSTMRIRQVIDGQQRLATLQVLFAATHDVAASRQVDQRYLTALRKLTHNNDEMSRNDDDVYKLWPTFHDWKPFRATMSGGTTEAAEDAPALVQAYAYFVRAVRAWAAPMSGDALEAGLDRMIAVLNHGMRLVVLDLTGDDNPQVIFESLNGRGVPLQISDLVRNHVFYLAEQQNVDMERLYNEYWVPFEDGFWRDDIGKGPRGGSRIDVFLAYFLTMELRGDVPLQEIFIRFRGYLAQLSKPVPQVMARLAAYGDIYRGLDERTELDTYESAVMSRIDLMDTAAIMPLLLHIFGEYDAEVRRGILELLDSYLIRRVIMGWDAKSYGKVAIRILQRIYGATDPVAVVRHQLSAYRGKSSGWPTDADITRSVLTRSMANTESKRIKLILSIIDAALRTPLSEKIGYDIADLTVEHMMPQSWNEHWPLGTATATQRRELVYTLGNLTLVTEALNGEMGNEPWATKRDALAGHSRLHLNHRLPDEWDEEAIRARGAAFAELLVRARPGPDTAVPAVLDAGLGVGDDGGPDDLDSSETEDETLAELMEDSLATPRSPAVPPPPAAVVTSSDDPITRHVHEVLSRHPRGTRLTPGQFARTASREFPAKRPGVKTFMERIRNGRITGVESTTNKHGHLAARFSKQPVNPEPMAQATTILRAPAGGSKDDALRAAFHFEMVRLYARSRDEASFTADRFLNDIKQYGGVAVAKHLLAAAGVSAGFRALNAAGRLDLTVEALVLHDRFAALFTVEEFARARERLAPYGGVPAYRPPPV